MQSSGLTRKVVAVLAATGVAWASVAVSNHAAEAIAAQPRTDATPTTTYAVVKRIPVGLYPAGIAIDNDDDTVYVANGGTVTMSIINGRTAATSSSPSFSGGQHRVAVNQVDDTVYVLKRFQDIFVLDGKTGAIVGQSIGVGADSTSVAVNNLDDTVYVANFTDVDVIDGATAQRFGVDLSYSGGNSQGVAVDQSDDTVYVSSANAGTLSVFKGGSSTPITAPSVGTSPSAVAVNDADDRVYVALQGANSVAVVDGRTGAVIGTSTGVGQTPISIAVDQIDDTVYVANYNGNSISVIDGRSGTRTDDTIAVGARPNAVAVDGSGANSGTVYVANSNSHDVSVIARVTPSLSTYVGNPDDTVTLSLSAPQVPYEVDDSTVTSVMFGGTAVQGVIAGVGNTWTMAVPAGIEGSSVPVTVTLNGGLTASVGTFTYYAPPPPGPAPAPEPATPPTSVVALAEDASALVTWEPPASAGSYPVSNYQVSSSPEGRGCVVVAPALSCSVMGLANGRTYTFTVAALTGAGWSASSEPSNPVTPRAADQPSIVITGARDGKRIEVTGSTTGFGMGAIVNPWVRLAGQSAYAQGSAQVLVGMDGTFTWGRITSKKAQVYMQTPDGSTRSNTVTVAAR